MPALAAALRPTVATLSVGGDRGPADVLGRCPFVLPAQIIAGDLQRYAHEPNLEKKEKPVEADPGVIDQCRECIPPRLWDLPASVMKKKMTAAEMQLDLAALSRLIADRAGAGAPPHLMLRPTACERSNDPAADHRVWLTSGGSASGLLQAAQPSDPRALPRQTDPSFVANADRIGTEWWLGPPAGPKPTGVPPNGPAGPRRRTVDGGQTMEGSTVRRWTADGRHTVTVDEGGFETLCGVAPTAVAGRAAYLKALQHGLAPLLLEADPLCQYAGLEREPPPSPPHTHTTPPPTQAHSAWLDRSL